MTAQPFGSRLQRLMAINGISEVEVVVQTLIDPETFDRWVSGELQADLAEIAVLADYFGCNEHWLATGEGEPYLSSGKAELDTRDETSAAGFAVGDFRVSDKSLQEIAEWISEQQDGINYGEVVKSLLARDFPEFREWLQKRYRG